MTRNLFPVGTRVRLTGPDWDSDYPVERGLRRGLVVTITGHDVGEGDGEFVAGLDTIPWYASREGAWAAEPVQDASEVVEAREALKAFDGALVGVERYHAATRVADALRDLLKTLED